MQEPSLALSASVKVTVASDLRSVDRGVFKCRNVAPGSMGGCSGSPAYIGSAELNIARLHSTMHAHDHIYGWARPMQHSGYWQAYVILTKNPTGFLPQDCEPGLWGEKGNRCRIDWPPSPPSLPCNDPPGLVMWSRFRTIHMYTWTPDLLLVSLHQHLVTRLRVVVDVSLICWGVVIKKKILQPSIIGLNWCKHHYCR